MIVNYMTEKVDEVVKGTALEGRIKFTILRQSADSGPPTSRTVPETFASAVGPERE